MVRPTGRVRGLCGRNRWGELVGGAAALAIVGFVGWAYYAFTEQINNSIILERYAHRLLRIRSATGSYPTSFKGEDRWGYPVAYFHSKDHFAIVSFGIDHRADRSDYSALFENGQSGRSKTNCLTPSMDTVFVDGVVWQACFK